MSINLVKRSLHRVRTLVLLCMVVLVSIFIAPPRMKIIVLDYHHSVLVQNPVGIKNSQLLGQLYCVQTPWVNSAYYILNSSACLFEV